MDYVINRNCVLFDRQDLEALLSLAERPTHGVFLDAEVFRDLCLQAFWALGQGATAVVDREALQELLANAEARRMMDVPSDCMKKLCRQALEGLPADALSRSAEPR